MDPSKVYTHQQDNGFVLVAEHMEAVSSASFTFLLPAGAKHDPADGLGSSAVLLYWVFRGAGKLDSRRICRARWIMCPVDRGFLRRILHSLLQGGRSHPLPALVCCCSGAIPLANEYRCARRLSWRNAASCAA